MAVDDQRNPNPAWLSLSAWLITSPILLRSKELAVRSSTTSQCLQRHQDCCPRQESDILAKPALRVV